MTVHRCPTCKVHIEWLRTGMGRRLPFTLQPIPIAEVEPDEGWVTEVRTIRGRRTVVLVPIAKVSILKREAIRHVVLLHAECGQYKELIDSVLNPPAGRIVRARWSETRTT